MKNKKGFTLIEIILVIALLGIVLSLIFTPLLFSFKNYDTQNEKSNIISDSRAAMDYITREIRKSNQIEIIDDIFTIGTNTYKLENGILYKDDIEKIEGIDELEIIKNDKKIEINITIKDKEDKENTLSSIIYIR